MSGTINPVETAVSEVVRAGAPRPLLSRTGPSVADLIAGMLDLVLGGLPNERDQR